MQFSLYQKHSEIFKSETITVGDFLNAVKYGKWQKQTDPVKAEPDKVKRKALKDLLPCITASGVFKVRNKSGLEQHSGFLAIDFDNLDDLLNAKAAILEQDPYSYAVFRSVSGTGLCVFVQIDGARHLDSFLALEEYYLKTYGLLVDTSCKNLDRLRYVTTDPGLFTNLKSKKFTNYLPKKALKKVPDVVYSDSDIKHILDQVREKNIDLTHSSYDRYLKIAFALQAEYGGGGRDYFHVICQNSEKYNFENADRQFTYCLKSNKTGITIATLFYYAKEAGLETVTKKTVIAATVARQVKRSGRDEDSARKALEMDGMKGESVDKVISQIFEGRDIKTADGETLIGQLEIYLSMNYKLRRNSVTGNLELNGRPVDDVDINSIYISCKKAVDEKITRHDLESLINSEFIDEYNPILNFFDTYRSRNADGVIDALADTIRTNTGYTPGSFDPDYVRYFLKKWLVGVVALAHGHVSPLLLALTGGQNTGKTQFFRRLLPAELKSYYAESKLDAGKDDYILMCQKLIIMDDELSGKSKKDEALLKELTSRQNFTLRLPYGRRTVEMQRLAALCGTSNPIDLLSDPTGNRRIIPVNVAAIDHAAYNAIDKVDLFMEAYRLFNAGYEWDLNRADIDRLNGNTGDFEQTSIEIELLLTYFIPQDPDNGALMTGADLLNTSQIKAELEKASGQRLSLRKLGLELKNAGFKKISKKIGGKSLYVYPVRRANGAPTFDLAPGAGAPEKAAAAEAAAIVNLSNPIGDQQDLAF